MPLATKVSNFWTWNHHWNLTLEIDTTRKGTRNQHLEPGSQYPEDAPSMGVSDRVLAIVNGKVVTEGDHTFVQSHPEVVSAYLGDVQ